jgi:hypothetical protein
MSSVVELADRYSRRRAILVAAASLIFLSIHAIGRPFLYAGASSGVDWWALNAGVLLVALATGGGLLNRRRIRALVNDDVAKANYRQSVFFGFWTTMLLAMLLYLWPAFRDRSARDALFVLVTAGIGVSTLMFAWLELRAHRDA